MAKSRVIWPWVDARSPLIMHRIIAEIYKLIGAAFCLAEPFCTSNSFFLHYKYFDVLVDWFNGILTLQLSFLIF